MLFVGQDVSIDCLQGANIVLWGVLLMLQASTNNFGAFFALRFLLGMLTQCMFVTISSDAGQRGLRNVRVLRGPLLDLDYLHVL